MSALQDRVEEARSGRTVAVSQLPVGECQVSQYGTPSWRIAVDNP